MKLYILYFISFGIFLFLISYAVSIYNMLIMLGNNVSKAWANINVLLVQRHDEIPKLIDTCKNYMNYEQETLTKVIHARQQVEMAREKKDINDLGKSEASLQKSLNNLLALVENYPDLKANNSFQQLSQRISQLESYIADRREIYNDSVNLNNVRIHQFPLNVIASLFGFKEYDLLKFSAEEQADININQLFAS